MKSLGIIRRCDDLGRVVIPKEIRRSLKIRDGAPLEIFTYQGAVCFKPYNPIGAKDWIKIKYILDVLLPCAYDLKNLDEETVATNINADVILDREIAICVNGELVGVLWVNSTESEPLMDTSITNAVKVVQRLLSEE
jgi:AbrB family looped-hinge helix DNA binding protein